MSKYQSTKLIELGSTAFRQWRATHSHCKFIHGYQLKAKLWFGCNELDERNWCVDFGGLKELKQHLQELFDHTTTVAADDPELETFRELDKKGMIQLVVFEDGVGIERVAEAVYKRANEFAKQYSQDRCWVDKVEVFEHEDNSATYSECCNKGECEFSYEVVNADEDVEPTPEELSVKTPPLHQVNHLPKRKKPSGKTKGNWFNGTKFG